MTDPSGAKIDTGAGYQTDGSGVEPEALPPEAEAPPPATEEPQGNPLTALVQERQGRRDEVTALQSELAGLRAEVAAMRQPAAQPEAPAAPWKNPHSATEAPVDYLQAEIAHTNARLEQAEQGAGQRLETQEQQTALADFERGVLTELQLGMHETPELAGAYAHVSQQFGQMAKASGVTGAALASTVRNNMLQAYLTGAQQGKSAAQVTAELALGTGYQAKPATPKEDPLQRGQKAAEQSIGGATGGGGVSTPPGAAQLATMTKEQLKANKGEGLARIKQILRGEIEP